MGINVDTPRSTEVSSQNQAVGTSNPAGTIAQVKSAPVSNEEINNAFRQFWGSQADRYLDVARTA